MLKEKIKRLDEVSKDIAILLNEKEDLVKSIIEDLNHAHDGQKSYTVDEFKLEVRTPSIYSLDKKHYAEVSKYIPAQYNPVKESVSYTVDKKKCDEVLKSAPADIRKTLIDIIEKKAGKPNINVKFIG